MLQPSGVAQALDAPDEGIVAYWRMVVRHRWTVVLIAVCGALAGILFTLPQTPIYQAVAMVELCGLRGRKCRSVPPAWPLSSCAVETVHSILRTEKAG